MTINGLPLEAMLIIDNCVLSLLCDYCKSQATGVARTQKATHMIDWVCDQLGILRSFTPDGLIHISVAVSNEFDGYGGKLGAESNLERSDCQRLVADIKEELNRVDINDEDIATIRNLPNFPVSMFSRNQLGDNDISLAVLALQLATGNDRVFVLTNDQQLLWFISWLRVQREARGLWGDPRCVEGIQSLTYLENVHRHCTISTQEMVALLQYALRSHYSRETLVDTSKGNKILNSLLTVETRLFESIGIKMSAGGTQ